MQGSGGPSHLDAKSLKRLMTNKIFQVQAEKILSAITSITNKMSAKEIIREDVEPLMAVRMIAVKKKDGGIRPVGISEIIRRVIAKTIAWTIKDDIKQVTGTRQCAGLQGACEASVKAIDELYQEGNAILVLDAEGAYNNLNRCGALKIAAREIPDAYQALRNF